MIPELRQDFYARFTPEKYSGFPRLLDERCGVHVPFRNCETLCFFPAGLLERMARDGADLARQLTRIA